MVVSGIFITFEGIEGSGKSTQARRLAQKLESLGYDVVLTREPGGTKIGERIREILLSTDSDGLVATSELLLYLADRVQHQSELIIPALKQGKVVVSDRYFDASIAYQARARGLGKFAEDLIFRFAEPVPDLTLLLDCSAEVGLRRARGRIEELGEHLQARFEAEEIGFHRRVRAAYLALAQSFPDRIKVVNSELPPDEVFERVWKIVSERMGIGREGG